MSATELNEWIICRICLKKSVGNMKKIFVGTIERETLAEKIALCGGVPIEQTVSNLPDMICSKCETMLKVAYKFRKLCQRSYKHLTQLMQTSSSRIVVGSEKDLESLIEFSDIVKQEVDTWQNMHDDVEFTPLCDDRHDRLSIRSDQVNQATAAATTSNSPVKILNSNLTKAPKSNINNLACIQRIEHEIGVLNTSVQRVLYFISNIEKVQLAANPSFDTDTNQMLKDYSMFRNLVCHTVDDLRALENNLVESDYFEKFVSYLKYEYHLNGKGDGSKMFRKLTRRLIDPNVLINYSWLGQNRTAKNLCDDLEKKIINISFQSVFPNFIDLTRKVCCSADQTFTKEKTENEFKNMLRNKKKTLQRAHKRRHLPDAEIQHQSFGNP